MRTPELQQAIYDRLTGYFPLMSKIVGVYTRVPQATEPEDDSAFPYVTIGPFNVSPFDTKLDNGAEVVAQVHIWSRGNSDLAWREIEQAIYNALHKYRPLAVASANVIDCLFESSTDTDDPDGLTTHVVMSFRITYFNT